MRGPKAKSATMPVPVGKRSSGSGEAAAAALHSKEMDDLVDRLVDNPTAFTLPSEPLANQVRVSRAFGLGGVWGCASVCVAHALP